ncbi:ribonuclease G [Ferrimonas pelagia]|uniref:Ribonuclease G n=1 Tax=Ferrimonas pelagia TaxID=1177826 RepID=A0ABP9FGP6_9GAMM
MPQGNGGRIAQTHGVSAELLINTSPTETRVALVEHGMLQEVQIERSTRRGIVGNIYRGKITRVLPGMQAAFVDIGQERAAFLHASDIVPHTECVDDAEAKHFRSEDIASLVRQGQDIMVQVVKDPLGTKGARLTTDITLPSRYLVFMPGSAHVGVSQRVEDPAERDRLKNIVGQFVDSDGGYIIRTAAENASEVELAHDAAFLRRVWKKVMERRRRSGKTVQRLYEEPSLPLRIVRDMAARTLDKVQTDSQMVFEQLQHFVSEFMPDVQPALELYRGKGPIFDLFDVENEIQRALQRKVELKSGGYLIIDQTEAMTTIDINTGAFVGHRNLEETIFNTNQEATQAIARQLRLRNLGGIIIIDFIDMVTAEHKQRVLHSLELALGQDRVKTSISGLSQLGLVEMTRKRTRESLEHVLCGECPSCRGTGQLKTPETVCYELYREIIRVDRAYDVDEFVAYVAPAVQALLEGDEAHSLAELEVFTGKRVRIKPEPLYAQDKFDVVMM